MPHKIFILTRQRLQKIKAINYVLAGLGFGILWTVLFLYILPVFVDLLSNSAIALLEEVIRPIGSTVPIFLFGFALFIWIAKIFLKNYEQKDKS